MGKRNTTTETASGAKKTRVRKPQAYVAKISGVDQPVLIFAKSRKDASGAVLKLALATDTDLLLAGKEQDLILDTAVPSEQVSILQAVKDAA